MKKYFLILLGLFLSMACFVSTGYAQSLAERVSGKILLQVERNGEGWYVDPISRKKSYLGSPADAFQVMRKFGLGISHDRLQKYLDSKFPSGLSGRILLDIEANGEAYYVNPDDLKGHYFKKPEDALKIMKELGQGITNNDLGKIKIVPEFKEYRSEELGIAFEYPAHLININRKGNSIYLENKTYSSAVFMASPIIVEEISDEQELETFIKEQFGDTCTIEKERSENIEHIYNINIIGDGKMLHEGSQCFINYVEVTKYSDRYDKVFTWSLGQACNVLEGSNNCHDDDIKESIRFIN
jgi:hypothetical protein